MGGDQESAVNFQAEPAVIGRLVWASAQTTCPFLENIQIIFGIRHV